MKNNLHNQAPEQRKLAEEIVLGKMSPSPDNIKNMSPEEIRWIIHELQIHQIELKLQNEELLRAQIELDAQKKRFFDLYDLAPVGYCTLSDNGLILEANLTASTLFGVPRSALIRQPLSQFILREDQNIYFLHKKQLFQTLEPQECQLRIVKGDKTIFWAHLETIVEQDGVGTPVCQIGMRDISEQKFREDMGELATLLISHISVSDDLHRLMSNLTASLQDWSGCQAVGIRLKDGDDYPYFETRGFPAAFVEAETHLCVIGKKGAILRDSNGNPVLECMCGNILRGRFDAAKPFFTANGSFWSNSTTALLASTTEADRQARTRNRCNGEGYESVALIPLRVDNQILGLLQFNDQRRDRFSSALIAHFEKIADIVANALWRRQTVARLGESEAHYRSIFNNSLVGVTVTDKSFNIADVNDAFCTMLEYSREELIGKKKISDITHPDDVVTSMDLVSKLMRHEIDHYSLEKSYVAKTGKVIPTLIYVRGRYNNAGDYEGTTASILDISERVQAEQALRREQIMLARTESIAHVGSWEWDIATDTVIWSDELFRIFQRDPRDGSPSFAEHPDLYHPDDIVRLRQAVELAIAKGTPYELELRAYRKDGQTRICKAHGFSEMGKTGKAVRLFGSLQDITERKKAEESYQTLFREMLDGFALHEIICDEAGLPSNYRFLAVNPAFERMTGLRSSDVIGQTVLEVIPGTELHWIKTYGRVALTGEPAFFENFAKDLGKYFQVTAFCPEPGQFACIFADITDRRKAEEEQYKLREHLQHAQKMEAIGTLAGGIAHDFNNILGAILGYAEMAQEDSQPESTLRGDIDQVVKASHRAKDLVKQILAFSRQDELQKIPMGLAALVKESIKLLRSSIPTTIHIRQDIDSKTDLILGDPTQIHQIILNLSTNAYHAMEETGGTLSIALRNKVLAQHDLVGIPDMQPGNFVQLSISDTGPGIPPEIQKRIFDPYFTTKEAGKGTGMGLSIVHGIVKSYGGFITCSSEVGAGTLFQICFPAASAQSVTEAQDFQLVPGGTERILFIDDEEILAEMGQKMLERLGYHVTVRSSSLEALTTFQDQPDKFDLVITDQTMPGMTGSDLARRILQIRPFMPIILCTGYSSVITKEKAKSLGIKGFAMKPLARKSISALIREVLDETRRAG